MLEVNLLFFNFLDIQKIELEIEPYRLFVFLLNLDCTLSSLPRTTRGMPLVISGSPDGKKIVYCNGNSVYIRNIEVNQIKLFHYYLEYTGM